MLPALHYPDLVPPAGWTYHLEGTQICLSPPKGQPPATLVIGPLLGRHDRLPPPERLLQMAISLEEETRFAVTSRGTPKALTSQAGLAGLGLEVSGYLRPDAPRERRMYVLYADDCCYYSIALQAPEESFAAHEAAFLAAARSMKPFAGERILPPSAADGSSPMSGYED